MLRRFLRICLGFAIALAIIGITAWGVMALWYRLPFDDLARNILCGLFGLTGLFTLAALVWRRRARNFLPFLLAVVLLMSWWSTLHPPSDREWSPEVARQVTGQINGDILTLDGVRDFQWRSDGSFDENWEVKTYDLSQLVTTDLFLSYWAGPEMAHFILSFGFADGRFLAWSIEVKRQKNGGFSPIADMFKENTIAIVAATELDVIGLRTNIRKENVQLFRLRTDPNDARKLLQEYVRDANILAKEPHWYNSITTNCTTVVLKMLNAIGNGIPFDWRIIVNGYLPEYGYERGSVNTGYSIEELRELGSVSPKGQAFGLRPGFSDAIRQGVPSP